MFHPLKWSALLLSPLLLFFILLFTPLNLFGQSFFSPTEKETFEEGQRLMGAGDLDGAILSFKDVLLLDPSHTPSYLLLGVVYIRKGKLEQAIDALEQAITINDNLLAGHLLLGQAYAAKGFNPQAKAAFERTISIDPDFPAGYFYLGVLYQGEGVILKAVELYRTAVALGGDVPEVKQARGLLAALKKEASVFFDQGIAALNKSALKEASDAFQKVLVYDPDNPFALYNLGTISIEEGHLDTAVAFLKDALGKKEDFFSARLLLGETFEKQGRISDAILTYQTILAGGSDREQREALLAKQKLSQIGATPEIGKIVQGLLKEGVRLLGNGDFEGAKAEFSVVLAFLPRQILVHYQLGVIALQNGALEMAEKKFKESIEIDRNHFPSYFSLGEVYERRGDIELAIQTYEEAARMRPLEEGPKLRIGILFEKKGEIKAALNAYHQVVDLPGGTRSSIKKLAQQRIDLYEKKFILSFTDTAITYDSNRTLSQNPVSEVISDMTLGVTYFLQKKDQFRVPLQFTLNNRFLHRAQLNFLSGGVTLFYIHSASSYAFLQGYSLRSGSTSGDTVRNGKSFLSNAYHAEVTKRGRIPTSMTLRFGLQRLKVFSNPIFSSKRTTATGTLSHDISIGATKQGTLKLTYTFTDNDIEANDQTRRSHAFSLNYNREIIEDMTGNIGISSTYRRFRHVDSISLSKGESQHRKNHFESATIGLFYQLQPDVSLFASVTRQRNRSNLPISSSIGLVDINSGQVSSLGSYDQTLATFGITASANLENLTPHWSKFGKRLSVGLTSGYYRPSLTELNQIIGDPKQVITQDPNHLLPSNPNFLSETRNLAMGKIKGSQTTGVEIEWEASERNSLVLSVSEWQNSTIRTDLVPLLLSPSEPALMVPRSARYNLTINQVFLMWRYALLKDPAVGRIHLDLSLLGGAFTNLTIDSLMKVETNPAGNPFVSLGSIEARGRSFITRAGIGGEVFIRPWLSIGLNVNYLWGKVTKLTVERAFPSDFRVIPAGLPGVTETPCFRLIDTQTAGETLNTLRCEGDLVAEGTRLRVLKLRLDGYEARMALRFHFGEQIPGKTVFEKWMNWGETEDEKGIRRPFLAKWFPHKERLKLDGTLKHEVAYRVHKPVTFTKALTLFRLNTRYSPSSKYHITGRIRAFYDAIYDLVDIDTISPRRFENTVLTQISPTPTAEEVAGIDIDNSRGVDIAKTGIAMRELFLDVHFKKLDLRIGKQIVRWGVVPGSRVTDEINPFDFGEFILREMEDRFIPLMMVKADFFPGASRFELIWITEVVPHKPAPQGSEFEQLQVLPGFVAPDSFLTSSLDLDAGAFENTEVAARFIKNFSGWEIGFTAFYTWDDFPASFRVIEGASGGGFQTTPEVTFAPRMNRMTTVGTTLSKSFGRVVLNAEYAYVFGKLFGTLLNVGETEESGSTLGELKRDFMKYAVGLDFALYNTEMSVQFLQQVIPEWNDLILQDRIDTVVALFGRKTFLNERLTMTLLTLYFINEDDFLVRPALEARLTDNVKTRFGADLFIGDRGEQVGQFDFIGFFKDSNRLFLEIIYSF